MRVVSRTHVGMIRNNNEDALLVREPYLYVVADGMGGHAAGEIASRATLKAFEAATGELCDGHILEEDKISEVLKLAFQKANTYVYDMASNNEEYKGMGTTMTSLYLAGDMAFVAHVGDSRLYVYRDNKLLQITRDQTYVARLVETGEISEEEAQLHPQRHMLMKAIGVDNEIWPDILGFELERNDKLLLCSDGLSDMLQHQEIGDILAQDNLDQIADGLLEKALDNGGRDNITLILLDMAPEEVE